MRSVLEDPIFSCPTPTPKTGRHLSNAAIRPSVRPIRPFICLSHHPTALGQERCILGLWLLQNTNRKPHAGIRTTGQRGDEAVAGAASEAFARWLHHNCHRRAYRFAVRYLVYCGPGRGAEYCNERVCLSACLSVQEHISRTTRPNFTKFAVGKHAAGDRGSLIVCQRCNMICTSGFVDDVMFFP